MGVDIMEHHKLEFDFSDSESRTFRKKNEPRLTGEYFGFIYINDSKWAVVLWDGCSEPEVVPAHEIEISVEKWVGVETI